jgi:serine phosphatase RsbU (regulator of sigma subunit)
MKKAREIFQQQGITAIMVATIMTIIVIGVQYYIGEQQDEEKCNNLINRDLQIASLRIDSYLKDTEWSIEHLDEQILKQLPHPDSMYVLMHRVVDTNPLIIGCAIGFRSNYYPEKGHWYEPCAYRDGDSIVYEQAGGKHHDYFNMEWYKIGLQSKGMKGKWTSPYRDNTQNNRLMMSYCRHVKHRRDTIGVVSLDVSMEWITQILRHVEPYAGSVCQLLSKNGEVIVASDDTKPDEDGYFIRKQAIGNRDLTLLLACPKKAVYGYTILLEIVMTALIVLTILLLTYIARHSVKSIHKLNAAKQEQEIVKNELHIARAIQMAMLPKSFPPYPNREDITIYGQLTPAKEVGGDLFDFYIRDDKLFFCIGDVSGKGVPASLVMAVTKASFRTISAHESQPECIVSLINDTIAEENETNMFVTLFLGVLDLKTGDMSYCNAGHDAPILISKDGKRIGLMKVESNLPVGVMKGWKYKRQENIIDGGTTIFLYTDGLNEAENIDHGQFGEERMLDVARKMSAKGNVSPEQLIKQMVKAVHDFVGKAEQSDDLTMMTIQYNPKE